MADLPALRDLFHYWGSDLSLSPTGDLAPVEGVERSKQRVLRRLLTNPGDYVWHPTYGAGLPRFVGANLDAGKLAGLIRGQMLLEASVSRSPAPTVAVQPIANGVSIRVTYTALPDRQPVALSFSVDA